MKLQNIVCALENIPQIIISTLYATQLVGFDNTVLAALLSSMASVILALFSAFLEFPQNYYIYQIGIKLNLTQNPKLLKSLRMTMDRDHGFLFVENVYINGNDFLCFNIVSSEPINDKNNAKSISMGSNNTDQI